jgi:hypothetical protein
VTRRTHAALEDFALVLRMIFGVAYGTRARFNSTEGTWKLPNGSYVELGMLADDSHYARYQGRSFSLIACDEASQYPTPRLLDLLRSNLRAERGVPTRFLLTGNPGSVGHAWVARRHVRTGAAPWQVYTERDTGACFVTCPSTVTDNPHVDADAYRRQLAAACAGDPELLRAWTEGDWSVSRGAFFGDVCSESRVAFGPWEPATWPRRSSASEWRTYIAHDFGSSAPSATYVCSRSPGATGPDRRWYPRESVLLLDELATTDPLDPTRGMGWTVPVLAEAIRELCGRWGVSPHGVADDAVFNKTGSSAGSIADEFRRERVHFRPARKGSRIAGWQRMRRLLADAGEVDGPGLYVSRACRFWWETVPVLPRDPRRPEDVDSRANDHAADATRYGVLAASVEGITTFDPEAVLLGGSTDAYEARWMRWERAQERRGGA